MWFAAIEIWWPECRTVCVTNVQHMYVFMTISDDNIDSTEMIYNTTSYIFPGTCICCHDHK